MSCFLSEVTPVFDNIIVAGDVNISLLNLSNPLNECFDSYGQSQIIDEPTRVTQTTATISDPIFISDSDVVV